MVWTCLKKGHGEWVKQETRLSLTNRETHLCKCNSVADLTNTLLPVCVITPNWVVLVLGFSTGEPPKLGSVETWCYPAECGPFRSNGTSVTKEILLKKPASHLSRSLKVIGTDTKWSATYDFLLTFHRRILHGHGNGESTTVAGFPLEWEW